MSATLDLPTLTDHTVAVYATHDGAEAAIIRSRAAVTALKSKVAPTATAMRDGRWQNVLRIVLLLIGFTLVAMLGFHRPPLQSLTFASPPFPLSDV